MLNFIKETESVWDNLRNTKKPIVLYGMGNGADKIIDWCEANSVKVSGIFATDEFVRYQSFRGLIVEKYSDIFESPTSGENLRNVSSITYRIEDGDDPNLPFKKLIREEIFKGVTKTKVLSENVNFFEIKPLLISFQEE